MLSFEYITLCGSLFPGAVPDMSVVSLQAPHLDVMSCCAALGRCAGWMVSHNAVLQYRYEQIGRLQFLFQFTTILYGYLCRLEDLEDSLCVGMILERRAEVIVIFLGSCNIGHRPRTVVHASDDLEPRTIQVRAFVIGHGR